MISSVTSPGRSSRGWGGSGRAEALGLGAAQGSTTRPAAHYRGALPELRRSLGAPSSRETSPGDPTPGRPPLRRGASPLCQLLPAFGLSSGGTRQRGIGGARPAPSCEICRLSWQRWERGLGGGLPVAQAVPSSGGGTWVQSFPWRQLPASPRTTPALCELPRRVPRRRRCRKLRRARLPRGAPWGCGSTSGAQGERRASAARDGT